MNDEQLTKLTNLLVDKRVKELLSNLDKNTQKLTALLADAKWSSFPSASTLTGLEELVGLQSGVNVQETLNNIKAFILLGQSLQGAYDGGADILLADGRSINTHDSAGLVALNIDPGSRKNRTQYTIEAIDGGMTSHLINQPVIDSRVITQQELDRVNINYSNNNWVYTIPNDVSNSFPNGTQFEVLQVGATGSLTVDWPPQVSVNGVPGAGQLILSRPYQRGIFREIGQNQWTLFTVGIPITPIDGRYSPVITLIQGLFSVSVVIDTDGTTELADYSANSAQPSVFITCRITFNVQTDGSLVQRQFRFSPPISSNFTTVGQARICGLPSIVKNPGTEGNTACGWNGNLTSDPTTKDILFSFETSELLTTYYIDLSFRYEKLA